MNSSAFLLPFSLHFQLPKTLQICLQITGDIVNLEIKGEKVSGFYYLAPYNWELFNNPIDKDLLEVLTKENIDYSNINSNTNLITDEAIISFIDYIKSRQKYLNNNLVPTSSIYESLDPYLLYDIIYFIEENGNKILDLIIESILFSTNYENILSSEDLLPNLFEITDLQWYDFSELTREELSIFFMQESQKEPTIYYETAYDTSKIAHKKGLKNIFVTNARGRSQ